MSDASAGPTRRVFLTGTGLLGAGWLAACTADHPRSGQASSDSLPGPDRLRAEAKHLEPATYVKTYDVDPTGATGTFRTFADAYEAITKDRGARIGTGAPALSNPWDWRCIRVKPGDYHECIKGIPPFTAIIGTGSRPEDVHVWWEQGDNTFESTGRTTYVRNIHLEHSGPQADAHPMRDNGTTGDVGLRDRQVRTVTFDSVRFTSLRTAPLVKCTNDMVPGAGTSLTFRSCIFDGPGQPQSVNLVTNVGPGSLPSTLVFMGCTVISNHEQHPDKSLQELGPMSAVPFGSPDFGRGRSDTVVWMDGRWDIGHAAGIDSLLYLPYTGDPDPSKKAGQRAATRYVIVNPGSAPHARTFRADHALPPSTTVPRGVELPRDGSSHQERTFFGSPPSQQGAHLATGSSTGTMQWTAGDVYWTAVPLSGRALYPRDVTVRARTKTGGPPPVLSATVALDDNGKPMDDGGGQTSGRGGAKTPATAALQPRWFYPGQGPVWVGVSFDQDVEVPATAAVKNGSFHRTGAPKDQFPSAAGLTPVSSGTSVPVVEIQNGLPSTMS